MKKQSLKLILSSVFLVFGSIVSFGQTSDGFTPNRVSKFSEKGELISSAIFEDPTTSNVGIGTDAPQEKLHINGNVRGNLANGALRLKFNDGSTMDLGAQNSGSCHIYTSKPSFYFNKPLYITGGKINAPSSSLFLQAAGVNRLVINNLNGNIGIGIDAPSSKLDISAGINPTQGNEYKMLGIGHNLNATTFNGFAFYYGVNGDASKGLSSSILSLKYENNEIMKFNESYAGTRTITLTTSNLNIINKTTPTISNLNINSNGNIAIGYPVGTNASQKLDVNGIVKANGFISTGTFTTSGIINNGSFKIDGNLPYPNASYKTAIQTPMNSGWFTNTISSQSYNSVHYGFTMSDNGFHWVTTDQLSADDMNDAMSLAWGADNNMILNVNGDIKTNRKIIAVGMTNTGEFTSTKTIKIENNNDGYYPSIILSGNAGREKSIIFTDGGTNPVWWFGRDDAGKVKDGIGLFSQKIGTYGDFPFWIKDDGEVNIGIADKNVIINGNLIASLITTNGLTNNGHLTIGGSDLKLGTMDGRYQGAQLDNRALVHVGDATEKTDFLFLNYAGDFESGVVIGGPKVIVDGILDVNKAIRAFDGVEIVSDKTLSLGPWKISQEGGGDVTSYLRINRESSGNGVTTVDKLFALDWNGNLTVKGVTVTVDNFPDYVFEKDYNLMSIEELDTYIKANKHLPNVPSAADVKENGANLGDLNKALLEKVEELTLYIIEQQKQINELKAAIKK